MTEAVLLVSHGSRDPRAAYVVAELVSAVAARTGRTVRAAHLDFTAPTPQVALRQLAADGFTSVRVVPLLFTPGYHLTHDVPSAVARDEQTAGLSVTVAPGLVSPAGPERALLLTALSQRLAQATVGSSDGAVTGRPGGPAESSAGDLAVGSPDGLVLASAGSSAAGARAVVEDLARDLGELHGIPAVAAFAAGPATRPAQALASLRAAGGRRPVVASLFVAPGRLPDLVARAATGVPVADPLGVSPAFVDLLAARAGARSGRAVPGDVGDLGPSQRATLTRR